ncbi:MAG TPA: hypothetical protein DDW52_04900 [Planctomycetaceae bacterium]|nr:hypothetical protein [Planctomycetaceae bacterium]
MSRISQSFLGLALLTSLFVGCGGGDFPTAPATGVVLCDGKPVPGALVFFEPQLKGEDAMVGKTGLGVANDEGKFSVKTYGANDGAVVGMHNVKVERGSGPGCDCAMNQDKVVLEVEVKSGEDNDFTINLPEKTRADTRAEQSQEDEDDEEDE